MHKQNDYVHKLSTNERYYLHPQTPYGRGWGHAPILFWFLLKFFTSPHFVADAFVLQDFKQLLPVNSISIVFQDYVRFVFPSVIWTDTLTKFQLSSSIWRGYQDKGGIVSFNVKKGENSPRRLLNFDSGSSQFRNIKSATYRSLFPKFDRYRKWF